MFPESKLLLKKMCGSLGSVNSNRERWGMKEGLGNCEVLGFGSMVESINKIYVSFFRVNLLITESTPFALFLDQ